MGARLAACCFLLALAPCLPALGEFGPPPVEPEPSVKPEPVPRCPGRPQCLPTFIARLKAAPFPIGRNDDGEGRKFFGEVDRASEVRTRVNRHGERYPEHIHYADPGVLFHVPKDFDPTRPFRLVVFFHGHESALQRDVVGRLRVTRQLDRSGLNAILIAPQLAKDAIDSHPGKLGREGGLARLLDEAAGVLARAIGRRHADRLAAAPVVLAAYSGGYRALTAGLDVGGVDERIEGVILLDTVFGEVARIDEWLERRGRAVFLVGLYGVLSGSWTLDLMWAWEARGVRYSLAIPSRIGPGTVALAPVVTDHAEIVTEGPPAEPIAVFLSRLGAGGR